MSARRDIGVSQDVEHKAIKYRWQCWRTTVFGDGVETRTNAVVKVGGFEDHQRSAAYKNRGKDQRRHRPEKEHAPDMTTGRRTHPAPMMVPPIITTPPPSSEGDVWVVVKMLLHSALSPVIL